MAKYASRLRPISLGCFPKYNDNKVLDIVNFDDRKIYESINCWGYIEYENEIPDADADDYDLCKI